MPRACKVWQPRGLATAAYCCWLPIAAGIVVLPGELQLPLLREALGEALGDLPWLAGRLVYTQVRVHAIHRWLSSSMHISAQHTKYIIDCTLYTAS